MKIKTRQWCTILMHFNRAQTFVYYVSKVFASCSRHTLFSSVTQVTSTCWKHHHVGETYISLLWFQANPTSYKWRINSTRSLPPNPIKQKDLGAANKVYLVQYLGTYSQPHNFLVMPMVVITKYCCPWPLIYILSSIQHVTDHAIVLLGSLWLALYPPFPLNVGERTWVQS